MADRSFSLDLQPVGRATRMGQDEIPEDRSPFMAPHDSAPGPDDAELMTLEEIAAQGGGDGALVSTASDVIDPVDHDENIAEILAQTAEGRTFLQRLGSDLQDMIKADEESREPWKQRFKRGLQIVGLEDFVWDSENNVAPFEGASTAIHPGISQAVVQSQARYMEELFPSAGPVKTMVMGQKNDEKQEAADRVADHMNYQLTVEDPTYFMETSKLAFYLPIFGTAYRKGYHDWISDKNVLRFCTADEVILPYSARNLATSPRITHKFKTTENDFRKVVRAQGYRDVKLQDPGQMEAGEIQTEKDRTDSVTDVQPDQDVIYEFCETDIALEIPGYEDADAAGKPTGVALPFTVTIDYASGEVLRIERNWGQTDPLKERRTRYAEYWYMPGIGSYGYGLIHLIGSLAESATDTLRALLDSATFANLQGGFKAKDAATKGGELHLQPGVWIDVDMTSDELAKAFHTPPFKEPSDALFNLLEFLVGEIKSFAGTTEMMVGEGDPKNAPVGTTVALIEQGSKVYAGVHKRGHFAAGIEFRMLFDLNSRYIPAEGYPYAVPGDDKAVYQADYDTKIVSVVPVSDPNIFSQTQRIAQAQTALTLAEKYPLLHRTYEVLKRMYQALKIPDWEEMVVDPDNVPDMDPVSENVAMATQRPVKAKEGQNHAAHLIVHMAFAQHPQYGGLPEAQKVLGPAMMAHIAEHVALMYADNQRALGVPVPPINLARQPGAGITEEEVPPQVNNVIAAKAAMMVGEFQQQAGLTTTPPSDQTGEDGLTQDDKRLKNDSEVMANLGNAAANFAKAGINIGAGALLVPGVDMAIHSTGPAPAMPPPGGAPAGPGPIPPGTGAIVPQKTGAPPPALPDHAPQGAPAAALPPANVGPGK